MLREDIHFKKFRINGNKILSQMKNYRPIFWDNSWHMVFTKMDTAESRKWLKDNIEGNDYIIHNGYSGAVIAFRNKMDSVKFKLAN